MAETMLPRRHLAPVGAKSPSPKRSKSPSPKRSKRRILENYHMLLKKQLVTRAEGPQPPLSMPPIHLRMERSKRIVLGTDVTKIALKCRSCSEDIYLVEKFVVCECGAALHGHRGTECFRMHKSECNKTAFLGATHRCFGAEFAWYAEPVP